MLTSSHKPWSSRIHNDSNYDGAQFPNYKVDALLRITDLRITSEPEDAPTYHYGEHIELTARTNAAVDVEPDGTSLSIHVGEGYGSEVWRSAHYNRGSGTDTLVFRYTVKALDVDTDGISAL